MPDCDQSQTRKPKLLMHCSEIAINYIVMHCYTLHYNVQNTATNCSSSDNKTWPNHVAGV